MQVRADVSVTRSSPVLPARPAQTPVASVDGYQPGGTAAPAPDPRRLACSLTSPRHDEASTPEAVALAAKMVSGRNMPSSLQAGAARDLASLPPQWLRRLESEDLLVAVLQEGQSLADLDVLPQMTPERCRKHFAKAQALAREAIQEESRALAVDPQAPADDFAAAMARRWLPDRIRENLMPRLDQAGIGFSVEVCHEPVDLRQLAHAKQVPDEDFPTWKQLLVELNGDLARVQGDLATASQEILMVPYAFHLGRPVSEVSRDNFSTFTALEVRQHRGINSWPNRLIMVHEAFVKEPADEVGNYRVLIHELGHAIDYLAEDLFPEHRGAVDALYATDLEAARRGEVRFLTPRSADNPREYLAEAMEAYMTRRVGDDQDFYKPENCREDLQVRNPALYAYVEALLQR